MVLQPLISRTRVAADRFISALFNRQNYILLLADVVELSWCWLLVVDWLGDLVVGGVGRELSGRSGKCGGGYCGGGADGGTDMVVLVAIMMMSVSTVCEGGRVSD